jgi:hypothetical protein
MTNGAGGDIRDLIFSTRNITNASTPAAERMRITNAGKVSCTGSIVSVFRSGGALIGSFLGIQST